MPEITSTKPVKPNLARAWFDTVLNPVIGGLRHEQHLLGQGNLTWRTSPRGFAALLPVNSHIRLAFRDNLDQLESFFPDLTPLMQEHDRRLQSLRAEVELFHDRLSARVAALGYFEPDTAPYMAEHVINNEGELPSYYGTAASWRSHRERLSGLTDTNEFRGQWLAIQQRRDDLLTCVNRLLSRLATLRAYLSEELDVPIAITTE